jgi:hypothetical protein
LDSNDLVKEIATFKSFLSDETVPATSKFKKEDLFDNQLYADYSAEYDKKNPPLKKV